MSRYIALLLVAAFLAVAQADVYLHSPRGQNDRCDEKSNNRNNENRCYNSQNNAAGGYSYCDKQMTFYTNTYISIQWYSQHNCGNGAQTKAGNQKAPEYLHCNYIFQIGCQESFLQHAGIEQATYQLTDGKSLGRPGADQFNKANTADDYYNTFGNTCTETKPTSETCSDPNNSNGACNGDLAQGTGTFNGNSCQCSARKNQTYCYHEPEAFWLKCKYRSRNKGLYTADQNVNNNGGATRTRQEPNSARYGFECPEEKDYWPYWHPTPWMDLVVFVSDITMCDFYRANSQNTLTKNECVPADGSTPPLITPSTTAVNCFQYNQQVACQAQSGCLWNTTQPWNWNKKFDCILAPDQPDNSLGSVYGQTEGIKVESREKVQLASYDWLVDDNLVPKGKDSTTCIIRLRYNISSYEIDFDMDKGNNAKMTNNPVYVSDATDPTAGPAGQVPLRLAINTAQYGRVFEDRTYSFIVQRTRPTGIGSGDTIWNVNVRGKRGNIAQVRNCFEYDFVPHILSASVGDYVFFQWCLSDYNDNGNAGEGRQGTDRVNVVPVANFGNNIQFNFTNKATVDSIFQLADIKALAWIGQLPENCYSVTEMLTTQRNNNQGPKSCHYLNGVRDNATGLPTSYFGLIVRVQSTGNFQYISSRNNNFSNRGQKAAIVVNTLAGGLTAGSIAGIVVGVVVGVAVIVGGVLLVVYKGGLSFNRKV